jgi:UDP-N-acetylmuramoylalanine--D-glutamate ligase
VRRVEGSEGEDGHVNRSARSRPNLPPGPFLVVGLARSGAAIARVLAERGEEVIGVDSGSPAEAAGLAEAGVEVSLGVDGTRQLDRARTVVKSPGVPQEAPAVDAARQRGIEVAGELELAWRLIPNRFCAVTGTNGKTTTTELLGHLHRTAGEPVAVAGNVGTPLATLAGEVDPAATVVCECSSFQLEDASAFAPECAVLLNIAPDHLDRHRTLEAYLAAKLRIFANQGNDDLAVYDGSAPELRDRDLGGCARRVRFCPLEAPEGSADPDCELSLRDGVIFAADEPLLRAEELRLLGAHNIANAMAAAAAALAGGLPREAVAEGLRSFEGVPHRLERVGEVGGVAYVNDSKATNVSSALAGIEAFDGGVHLILGGSLKGESFERLADPVIARCTACYLIGEASERLAADLAPAVRAGVELQECGALESAVEAAAARAQPGEVVLLSPACASFDAYDDFEERGEHFRSLVEALR